MDYKTKATSRRNLRRFSGYLRRIFGIEPTGELPVLEMLDKLSDIFPDCNYMIVEDKKLPAQTMAQCSPNDQGGFTIEIKESVYEGAYEHNVGAFRGFICHEICHVFLFKIGFTPIYARSFDNNELPAYCSVECRPRHFVLRL